MAKRSIILCGLAVWLAMPHAAVAEMPAGDNLLGFYTDPDFYEAESWDDGEIFDIYLCLSGYTGDVGGIIGFDCSYDIVGEGTVFTLSTTYPVQAINVGYDSTDFKVFYASPLPPFDGTVTLVEIRLFQLLATSYEPSVIYLHPSFDPEVPGAMSVVDNSETVLIAGWSSGDESEPVFGINTVVEVGGGTTDPFPDVAVTALVDDTGESWGAAWGDYDGDGYADLYVANHDGADVLYHNEGDGTFAPMTGGPLGYTGPSWGAAWGDYDRDGDLDLYLAVTGADLLLRNDGGGVFSDRTGAAALGAAGECTDATWVDADDDGFLDVYVVRTGAANLLYHNDGDGTFTAATPAPLNDVASNRGATWADFDRDGDMDVFLACSSAANKLLRNNGAAGFEDVTGGGALGFAGNSNTGAWGDYDNDGDLDLYVANYNVANQLLRNDSTDSTGVVFTEVFADTLGDAGAGIGAAWGDYDNDGDLDLFVGNSWTQPDKLFLNNGGWFSRAVLPSLTEARSGYAAAWADYDNDGDLDLFVANANQANQLFENSANGSNNWLQVDLDAVSSAAAGSTIRIHYGANVQARQVGCGAGWVSQEPHTAAFGLGAVGAIDSVVVDWSSGISQKLTGVAVDQRLTVTELLPMTVVASGLPDLEGAAADWGDFDNDGDLDLALCGLLGTVGHTGIYENTAGAFTEIGSGLPGVIGGSVDWGDCDGDGDLDLLLTGTAGGARLTRLYRNSGGAFVATAPLMRPVADGAAAWGDYDNDGDLDVLVTGDDGFGGVTCVYANEDGAFRDIPTGLDGMVGGDCAWGDYDNDGDLDIVLNGELGTGERVCRVYTNEDGVFGSYERFGLWQEPMWGAVNGSVAWGDVDADGDLDILICGTGSSGPITRIYQYGGSSYSDMGAGLRGVTDGCARWGDVDGDGDLDIALTGVSAGLPASVVCLNDLDTTGGFTAYRGALPDVGAGDLVWGDVDGDQDLDLLLIGSGGAGHTILNHNDEPSVNTAPAAPAGLAAFWSDGSLIFSWDPASDDSTPEACLSYNLRVGTSPGGSEICAATADGATGLRRVVAAGNAGPNTYWALDMPDIATQDRVYWSVQAIDGAFCGSAFAAEESYEPPLQLVDSGLPGVTGCAAEWGDYDGDGDLDLLLAGWTGNASVTEIYRNDAGSFVGIGAGLEPVQSASAGWGDCDNDGDVDLVVCGLGDDGPVTKIYRNDGGIFHDTEAALPGVHDGSVEWGDYDRDGDLDLLLVGTVAEPLFGVISRVYGNRNGVFVDAEIGLPEVLLGHGSWFDRRGDGFLSVLLTGWTGSETETMLYVCDPYGDFAQEWISIAGIEDGAVAWGHHGTTGDPADAGLDVLVTGWSDGSSLSRVYSNNFWGFSTAVSGLPGLSSSACDWADFDNDGDMDIVVAGWSDDGPRTHVYACDYVDQYDELEAGLAGVYDGEVSWADIDGDRDLDLLLAGWGESGAVTRLYRNMLSTPNTPPTAPVSLWAGFNGGAIDSVLAFSWDAGTDAETAAEALTYNLRVGTTPGGTDILSPAADPATGDRFVRGFGNTAPNMSWRISRAALGWHTQFYWSVQSVDEAFAGSPFTSEQMVSLGSTPSPAPGSDLPQHFALRDNYPNPFNPLTSIAFDLPRPATVRLVIYDPAGRRVRTLVGEPYAAGRHRVTWDGMGEEGRPVGSGVYLYRISAGAFTDTRRMTLVR